MTNCKDACAIRVPIKHKYFRSNQSFFLHKKFSKAVIDRTRLRNRFSRTRSNGDKEAFDKKRNYWVSLIRNTKQEYCSDLDYRKVVDKKNHISNLFFSEKDFSKITLVEKDLILEGIDHIAETFNEFFTSIV